MIKHQVQSEFGLAHTQSWHHSLLKSLTSGLSILTTSTESWYTSWAHDQLSTSKALPTKYRCQCSIARMQPNISHLVALYLDSVSFNLFEKYSTGCQTFPCCCSKTAPTAVPDASDLTCTGNSGSYTLRTGADIKASFSASKAACYSAQIWKTSCLARYQ